LTEKPKNRAAHLAKYAFKPGNRANPGGRPKLPKELAKIRKYISEEVAHIISKYLRMKKVDLIELMKDTDHLPMLDATICSILVRAYKQGDPSKLEFLLTRVIGKVKDVEIIPQSINMPQIVVSLPDNGTIDV